LKKKSLVLNTPNLILLYLTHLLKETSYKKATCRRGGFLNTALMGCLERRENAGTKGGGENYIMRS
jgi:hypothetical protein